MWYTETCRAPTSPSLRDFRPFFNSLFTIFVLLQPLGVYWTNISRISKKLYTSIGSFVCFLPFFFCNATNWRWLLRNFTTTLTATNDVPRALSSAFFSKVASELCGHCGALARGSAEGRASACRGLWQQRPQRGHVRRWIQARIITAVTECQEQNPTDQPFFLQEDSKRTQTKAPFQQNDRRRAPHSSLFFFFFKGLEKNRTKNAPFSRNTQEADMSTCFHIVRRERTSTCCRVSVARQRLVVLFCSVPSVSPHDQLWRWRWLWGQGSPPFWPRFYVEICSLNPTAQTTSSLSLTTRNVAVATPLKNLLTGNGTNNFSLGIVPPSSRPCSAPVDKLFEFTPTTLLYSLSLSSTKKSRGLFRFTRVLLYMPAGATNRTRVVFGFFFSDIHTIPPCWFTSCLCYIHVHEHGRTWGARTFFFFFPAVVAAATTTATV